MGRRRTMSDNPHASLQAGPEQVLYASVLEKGMLFGMLLLLVTYVVYVSGILDPYVPLTDIHKYWTMNVHDYLQQARIEPGWGWVRMLRYGDFLCFVAIALLAGVTIICFLAIIPLLLKQNDKLYAFLSVLEVIILCVAASGILGAGGH
jgi:hypothetical protein